MGHYKTYAAKVLADIAKKSDVYDAEVRIHAAAELALLDEDLLGEEQEVKRWYDVRLQDLTLFFLKMTVALAPAMLLWMLLYITLAIFTQVAPTIMGL